MSKEHFWPAWLQQHLTTSVSDKRKTELLSSDSKAPATLKMSDERSGNLISKKFRVVCTTCNNGWMSNLEERIKPILLPAVKGKSVVLDDSDISHLARWVVMKVMVAEHSEEGYQIWRHFKLNQLRCIFPNRKNGLAVKRLKVMNQRRLADLAHALSDLKASPMVKHIGPLST